MDNELDELKERLRQQVERLEQQRTPSKAHLFGDGQGKAALGNITAHGYQYPDGMSDEYHRSIGDLPTEGKAAAIRSWIGNHSEAGDKPKPGELLTAIWAASSRNYEEQVAGKAALASWGLQRGEGLGLPYFLDGKATLGDTGATGGYVLPNNLVDVPPLKPAVNTVDWESILTVRGGVAVRGVDLPYRTGAPARMTVQTWGQAKENVNEAYGSYTASLVTLARIYDVGKQYLRFSAGAAEADVMDEIGKGAALGTEYYILAGAGTAGNNGEPYGIYTAIGNAPTSYITTFSSAANNTIAGSAAAGLSQGLKALASRGRRASAIILDEVTLWVLLSQGSDNAGFWLSPTGEATGFTMDVNGQLKLWGVPILASPNFDSYTGTSKTALCLDARVFRLYKGLELRIESSDTAGSRWDDNLVGFRGEFEMGFNAASGVAVGAAQRVNALIP